jgi:hypothetical protein
MDTELVVLMVLATVLFLIVLSDRLELPYPILLVLGGLGVGFVPGIPDLRLEPDVVLLVVLPPLLYSAAFFSSLRELRTNLRPISLLAVGVVGYADFPTSTSTAATTIGSNCEPDAAVSSRIALSTLSGARYGRRETIASNASHTLITRLASGIALPRRPCG